MGLKKDELAKASEIFKKAAGKQGFVKKPAFLAGFKEFSEWDSQKEDDSQAGELWNTCNPKNADTIDLDDVQACLKKLGMKGEALTKASEFFKGDLNKDQFVKALKAFQEEEDKAGGNKEDDKDDVEEE